MTLVKNLIKLFKNQLNSNTLIPLFYLNSLEVNFKLRLKAWLSHYMKDEKKYIIMNFCGGAVEFSEGNAVWRSGKETKTTIKKITIGKKITITLSDGEKIYYHGITQYRTN